MAYDKFWDEIVSERTLMKGYFRQGHAEGHAEGRAEGLAEGLAEGEKKGRAEGLAEGRAEGRAEGVAEGEKKGRYDIARNLLAMGLPKMSVMQATGLTEEEIDKL